MNFSQEKKEDIMSPKAKSKDHLDKESQKQQDNNFNKLLKDNALNDNIDKTIHNYHIYIKAINMLLILFNVMFTEYLCMMRYVCNADGIEMTEFLSRSIPAFFFVSFFLQAISFKGAIEVNKIWVKRIKYFDFLYFLLLFFFAITAFILSSQVDNTLKNSTWNSLSPLSKSYYDNLLDNLVTSTKNNLILTGIFHLIVAILFLCNFLVLWNFDFVMPFDWRPKTRFQLSLEKDSILKESDKEKLLKRNTEKKQQAEEELFKSGPSDKHKPSIAVGGRFGSSIPMSSGSYSQPLTLGKIQETHQDHLY